jgi:hypothetical protein
MFSCLCRERSETQRRPQTDHADRRRPPPDRILGCRLHRAGAAAVRVLLKLSTKRFQAHSGLFDQTGKRAGLDRFMHGHDHGAALLAHDEMRAGLPFHLEAKPTQRLRRIRAIHTPRDFHATASTGSCVKWSRSRSGIVAPSKYPRTASVTMSCNSANVSPCVEIPPPAGSSQRATKPPVSGQGVTVKTSSMPPPYAHCPVGQSRALQSPRPAIQRDWPARAPTPP